MVSNWAWTTCGGSKTVASYFSYFPLTHAIDTCPIDTHYEEKSLINGAKMSIFGYETLYTMAVNWT